MGKKPIFTSGSPLRCRIITPEGNICDVQTDFVAVWLEDGQLGIAPGRKPMVAQLGIGPLRIGRAGQEARYYYVEGGLVEVRENVVTVLTERAIPAEELDAVVVAERMETAKTLPASSPELRQRREAAVRIAEGQWRVLKAAGR